MYNHLIYLYILNFMVCWRFNMRPWNNNKNLYFTLQDPFPGVKRCSGWGTDSLCFWVEPKKGISVLLLRFGCCKVKGGESTRLVLFVRKHQPRSPSQQWTKLDEFYSRYSLARNTLFLYTSFPISYSPSINFKYEHSLTRILTRIQLQNQHFHYSLLRKNITLMP